MASILSRPQCVKKGPQGAMCMAQSYVTTGLTRGQLLVGQLSLTTSVTIHSTRIIMRAAERGVPGIDSHKLVYAQGWDHYAIYQSPRDHSPGTCVYICASDLSVDSFTVPLHSVWQPVARALQGDCQGPLKNGGNSRRSLKPILHETILTYILINNS